MKGKIFSALVIAVAAAITTGPANAGCANPKDFSLAYGDSGNFDVVFQATDDTTVTGAVIGRLWQPGARATTGDETATGCADNLWLQPPSGAGTYTIFGENGGDIGTGGVCDSAVCPANGLIIVVQTKSLTGASASYTVGRTSEGTNFPAFDFARSGSDWNMVDIPRPEVTVPTPGGASLSVNVKVAGPATAFHSAAADGFSPNGTITGYQLVMFTGGSDPGREAGLWSNVPSGFLAPSAGAGTADSTGTVTVACPAGVHVFLANRPIFDGGQFSGDYVSASTDINCSNLANPGGPKIKPIGKKKLGL